MRQLNQHALGQAAVQIQALHGGPIALQRHAATAGAQILRCAACDARYFFG